VSGDKGQMHMKRTYAVHGPTNSVVFDNRPSIIQA
jgi:hypothetical protein